MTTKKYRYKDGTRRHHNNKGYRQIKNGKCAKSLRSIAKKLGIKFKNA